MKTRFILLFICTFLMACGGDKTAAPANTTAPAAPPANTSQPQRTKPPVQNAVALQSIPKETIQNLWNTCTYIDYIFHTLPFSMSQDEQGSIRANLSYISPDAQAYIPGDCKPMARQMFHVNGEIVLEADVYLQDQCKFYVFVENEKPVYANKMTDDALSFFSTMFQKVNDQQ